jgi:hypothetical protein
MSRVTRVAGSHRSCSFVSDVESQPTQVGQQLMVYDVPGLIEPLEAAPELAAWEVAGAGQLDAADVAPRSR